MEITTEQTIRDFNRGMEGIQVIKQSIELRDFLAATYQDADTSYGWFGSTEAEREAKKNKQLLDFLQKQKLEELLTEIEERTTYRMNNPDWERPVVMYGVRKQGHKCIKKQEIAVVVDTMPYQKRARTAETHWYKMLYRRPATDKEWEHSKGGNRRYVVFPYYIEKRLTVDRALSIIVEDDERSLGITDHSELWKAFENYYQRPIRFLPTIQHKQLTLF